MKFLSVPFYIFLFFLILFLSSLQVNAQFFTKIDFDKNVDLDKDNELKFQINILKFGSFMEKKDYKISYYIKNLNGDCLKIVKKRIEECMLIASSFTAAIYMQTSLVADLTLPKDLEEGSYELVVEIIDPENERIVSTSSETFFIGEKQQKNKIKKLNIIIQFLIFLILILVILFVNSRYKSRKQTILLNKEINRTAEEILSRIKRNK